MFDMVLEPHVVYLIAIRIIDSTAFAVPRIIFVKKGRERHHRTDGDQI